MDHWRESALTVTYATLLGGIGFLSAKYLFDFGNESASGIAILFPFAASLFTGATMTAAGAPNTDLRTTKADRYAARETWGAAVIAFLAASVAFSPLRPFGIEWPFYLFPMVVTLMAILAGIALALARNISPWRVLVELLLAVVAIRMVLNLFV